MAARTLQNPPAFQFYARDWIVSTMTLPCEVRGAYISLLATAWDRHEDDGGLPDNMAELAAYCGLTTARFTKNVWPVLSSKWTLGEDGLWRNRKLEEVRSEQRNYRAERSQAGKKGAAAKAAKRKHSSSSAKAQPQRSVSRA